jgi:hypothetical protein
MKIQCSIGQIPQWAVLPMEEEEEEVLSVLAVKPFDD